MCIDVRVQCECGSRTVQFHLRDNVLGPEALERLYCPDCPGHETYDADRMVYDNGWLVQYDMEVAKRLLGLRYGLAADQVTPGFIFDQGYACWLEMYPGEKQDIQDEKVKIQELLSVGQKEYLTAIQTWNIERVQRLKDAGWRKAQHT